MNFHGVNPTATFGSSVRRIPRTVPVTVIRTGGGATPPTAGQIWPRGSKS